LKVLLEELNFHLFPSFFSKAVLPSLGSRVMEGERKRRGLTNFHLTPEFIFVKVRGGNGGLIGRLMCYFLTNLFIPNLKGRKSKPPLIVIVFHSIPSLSASARKHIVRNQCLREGMKNDNLNRIKPN
jgi:hypothetical protein